MKKTKKKFHDLSMRAVRFELTHLSIAELKSAALDHSAKLAEIENFTIYLYILLLPLLSSYWKKYKPALELRFS